MALTLPDTWQLHPLEWCMAALIDYRGKTPRKAPYGVPLITAKVVKNGRILDTPREYIPFDDYDEWMRRGIPKPGDVVITTEAPLGEVAQLDERRVALAQRLITLRGKPGLLDNDFLKYLMQSRFVQHGLEARATGTTVLGIRQKELRKVTLIIPPLREQRAIAHILGTLDKKIELGHRMNQSLEAIARAIFKSWFVDFDPVHAKAAGEEPYGMDAQTAALFPDAFTDSNLGPIPAGWHVAALGDVLELAYGKGLKEADRCPGSTPVFGSNGQVGWHDRPLVKGPGIIVGRKGNPGTVTWSSTDFYPIDTTFYVVPKERGSSLQYLFHTLEHQSLPHLASDSAVPGLNRNIAYMNWMLVPSSETARAFDHIASNLYSMIYANTSQSRTLAELRDALLPRLISGRLRVPQA